MFEEFFKQHNIPMPPKPIFQNHFTRWGKNCRYSAMRLGAEGLYFEDFASGLKEVWFLQNKQRSPEEIAAYRLEAARAKRRAEIERKASHERAAQTVRKLWDNLQDVEVL